MDSEALRSKVSLRVSPAALFLQAMLEHYLFVDNYSILNFLFFLFSGYLVQLARGVTWKQVFPFLARRKKA